MTVSHAEVLLFIVFEVSKDSLALPGRGMPDSPGNLIQ